MPDGVDLLADNGAALDLARIGNSPTSLLPRVPEG